MGLFKKRSIALQGALWTLLRLVTDAGGQNSSSNGTEDITTGPRQSTAARVEGQLDGGSFALLIICLILISLTICAISFHYCNFKAKEKYDKLERDSELVEVDLYESDDDR